MDKRWPGDVDGAVDVIAVHVGENDGVHIGNGQARSLEGSRQLLGGRDIEARKRDVPHRRRLTGVDQPQPILVLDHPAVDRERL
jgi:hypothetical protein